MIVLFSLARLLVCSLLVHFLCFTFLRMLRVLCDTILLMLLLMLLLHLLLLLLYVRSTFGFDFLANALTRFIRLTIMWCPQRWNTYSWCFVTAPARNQKYSSDFWFPLVFFSLSPSFFFSQDSLTHHDRILRAVNWNIKFGLPISFLYLFTFWPLQNWLFEVNLIEKYLIP